MQNCKEITLLNNDSTICRVKPFLRWAGGKRWFLKELDKFVNLRKFKVYHEPFIGGGSIYFHLKPNQAIISDTNADLINTYRQVKINPEKVISQLKKFEKSEEYYYFVRNSKFKSEIKEAAKFIYLNQMSFNGIFRVNAKGEYNVPFGFRKNYNFDYENILNASFLLKKTKIIHQDFENSINKVKSQDLVFLDPPYTVTHNQNGFIHYNQKLFSLEDQYRLAKSVLKIKDKGAYYILTNAAHKEIRNIFLNGDRTFEINRASLIGGKNAARGKYSELIMTNIF